VEYDWKGSFAKKSVFMVLKGLGTQNEPTGGKPPVVK
jgi:hypothetical protein